MPSGAARGPIAIGWGRRDLVCLPSRAGQAVRRFPDARLHWFEHCGHFPQWDRPFAFFSGTQTLVTGDPHEGVDFAISGDNGASWALSPTAIAAGDFAGQRDASVALGPDGALASWYAGEETVTHLGTDPTMFPNQRGYGNGTGRAIAVSGGSALVAWCTGVQGPNGVFVQPVEPATAAPAGPARIVPGSTSRVSGVAEAFCPASTRVPLVARQNKGFFVATVDGKCRTVHGWSVAAPRALTLADGPRDGSIYGLDLNA